MYLWQSLAIVKPFFAVHSNLTYQSEAYDLIELYFATLHSGTVEHLRWSFFAETVNVLRPSVIFAGELHCRCL